MKQAIMYAMFFQTFPDNSIQFPTRQKKSLNTFDHLQGYDFNVLI